MKVKKNTEQLSAKDIVSTELSRPVNLKNFDDAEWVESHTALKFSDDILTNDNLNDVRLRKHLNEKAIEF